MDAFEELPAVAQAENLCRKRSRLIDGILYGHKLFSTDGLEELRKGSKVARVRIGLCVLLIVGKGISVAPYADKRLGHTASMAPPLPDAASLIKDRLGHQGWPMYCKQGWPETILSVWLIRKSDGSDKISLPDACDFGRG